MMTKLKGRKKRNKEIKKGIVLFVCGCVLTLVDSLTFRKDDNEIPTSVIGSTTTTTRQGKAKRKGIYSPKS